MSKTKQVRQEVRQLRRQGFDVQHTGSGHLRITSPTGETLVHASTPSDWRAERNNKARLKKLGFDPTRPNDRERKADMGNAKISATVLAALQQLQGSVTHNEVAFMTGLDEKQIMGALNYLVNKHPEVRRVERGRFAYVPATQKENPPPANVLPNGGKLPKGEVQQRVYDAMKKKPGKLFTPTELAKLTQLTKSQVANALTHLRGEGAEHFPGITRPDFGQYIYREPGEGEAKPVVRSNGKGRALTVRSNGNGNGNGKVAEPMPAADELEPVIASAVAVDEPVVVEVPTATRPIVVRPMETPEKAPTLFEAITLDKSNNLVLKDENGDLWLAVPLKPQLPS